jgi:hypothetical protein
MCVLKQTGEPYMWSIVPGLRRTRKESIRPTQLPRNGILGNWLFAAWAIAMRGPIGSYLACELAFFDAAQGM